MKEKRVTKKAILASLLSVVVCSSMLIGTSYAWFTDSAVSTGNKIVSGKLSIDFMEKNTDGEYESVDGKAIYTYDRWEPGYVSWNNLKVTTDGNLALKYTLNFTSKGDIKNAKLAEAIDVYYAPGEIAKPAVDPTRPTTAQILDVESIEGTTDSGAPVKLRKLGTLKDAFAGNANFKMEDTLIPEDAKPAPGGAADTDDYATLVLVMREEAGNEYQNLSIPEFDVSIFGTQYTYEIDTFDNQYDKDAPAITVSSQADLKDAIKNVVDGGKVVLAPNTEITDPIVVNNGKHFDLDLGGNDLSKGFRVYYGDVTVSNGTITNAGDQGLMIWPNAADDVTKVTIAENVTITGDWGITLFNADDGNAANIVVDMYGTVEGNIFVNGLLKEGNSVVNVYGTVNGGSDDGKSIGIAVNGKATVNLMDGSSVTGGTGVEVRAGALNVYEGATITATASPVSAHPNGSGTTTQGAGIGVSQHTTKLPISVNVYGGTINGYVPLYQINPQNNSDEDLAKISINVQGGTFNCTGANTEKFIIGNENAINYNNVYAN